MFLPCVEPSINFCYAGFKIFDFCGLIHFSRCSNCLPTPPVVFWPISSGLQKKKDRKKVDIWYIAMPWAVSKYSKHLLFHSSHHYICLQTLTLGSQVDAAVINRASHYCELGSILGSYVGCDWLIWIWLQGLFSLLSGFLPPQKWTFPPKSVSWSVLFMSLSGSGHWETTPNVEVAFTELLNGSMDIRRTLSEFPADFWACWWNFVTKYKTKSKENDKVTRANYS